MGWGWGNEIDERVWKMRKDFEKTNIPLLLALVS